jgi:thiamine-phosphate pyrophosphorylase
VTARRLPGRILALTPGDLRDESTAELVRRARAAVEAGLDSILLREPEMSDRATLELARDLRSVLGATGWLGIHDRVHLALAARADAVHLGFRSLAIREARSIIPDLAAIGFSAHAHDDPESWTGADYLVFGPVFETSSKRGVLGPVGVEGLAAAVRSTSIPIWALGGIDAARAHEVAETRCRGIAVRGALLGAHDARAAWQEFAQPAH